ncbi:Hypothetical predicted protein [Lecanosticta acicola]|uniref:Uncharacterized protein n=1 Tax=Lecanosticta acicola TaxID=111012 RepID=A0AAI8Z205_9PEZI|nr:Hypothetical predicted protein [Lecanosticta acicola]
MPPGFDRWQREANRRLNADLLEAQLSELRPERQKSGALRFQHPVSVAPEHTIVDRVVPRALVAHSDGDHSRAISSDLSDDGAETELAETPGDRAKAWFEEENKKQQSLGSDRRQRLCHGPIVDQESILQPRSPTRPRALLGPKGNEADEAITSLPMDYKDPKQYLSNSQQAGNDVIDRRRQVALGPYLKEEEETRDRSVAHVPSELHPNNSIIKRSVAHVPSELHPNNSIIKRNFIRRDSQQDGRQEWISWDAGPFSRGGK